MKKLLFTSALTLSIALTFAQWTPRTIVGTNDPTAWFVDAHPISQSTWLVAGLNHEIARTTNFGLSWTLIDTGFMNAPGFEDIDFVDANTGYIVGSTIAKTIDGGLSFTYLDTNLLTYFRAVKCVSANEIWVVGEGTHNILKSVDGGQTWIPKLSVGHPLFQIGFFTATDAIVVGQSGRIKTSSDGGQSWTPVTTTFTDYIFDVEVVNSTTCFIPYGPKIYKSTDKGQTWSPCNIYSSVTYPSFSKIDFATANIGYALAGSKIFKTIDGGITWYYQANLGYASNNISFWDELNGMVSGNLSRVYTTGNGGGAIATGVDELPVENTSVYPNPATNQLSINLGGMQAEQVNIYNIDGKLVSLTMQPQNNRVDISELAKGVYIAEIKLGDAAQRVRWVKM